MATLQGGAAPSRGQDALRLQDLWGEVNPGYVAGRWYRGLRSADVGPAAAAGSGVLSFQLIRFRAPTVVTGLAVRSVAVSVAANCQFAIYAHSVSLGRPTGAPLYTSASTAISTTAGIVSPATISLTLAAGWYWFAFNASSATPTFVTLGPSADFGAHIGASTAAILIPAATAAINSLSLAQTFGTMPTLSGNTFTEVVTSITPAIAYQIGTGSTL